MFMKVHVLKWAVTAPAVKTSDLKDGGTNYLKEKKEVGGRVTNSYWVRSQKACLDTLENVWCIDEWCDSDIGGDYQISRHQKP